MSRQTIERTLDVGGDKPAHQFSAPAAREIGIDQGALLHRCLVEPRGIEPLTFALRTRRSPI